MQTQSSSQPWWRTDSYDQDSVKPLVWHTDWEGPKGTALVRAWPSGKTSEGWGLLPPKGSTEGFMPRYMRGEFNERRALYGYELGHWAVAFVMRSLRLVCIDIDGKNGGLEHAKKLGALPPTMAETSKSGNGYHLFYLVDDQWDQGKGFDLLSDRIGLEPGVDIRATGCVYHHDTQRWNNRGPVELPAHLYDQLKHRDDKIAATNQRITKVLETQDEMEVAMMHDEILSDLEKPIPVGKRNNTLFAIGSQMAQAAIPDWEDKLSQRAIQVGLDQGEVDKLVANVGRYGAAVAP